MSGKSIGWIKERAACLELIHEQAPGIWKAVQQAIQADLAEFSNLFPHGPIQVYSSGNKSEGIFEVVFRANDETGAPVGHATLQVLFYFRHGGTGVGVISTAWPRKSEQFKRAVPLEFEISRCENGVALLVFGEDKVTPQLASQLILQNALFQDNVPF